MKRILKRLFICWRRGHVPSEPWAVGELEGGRIVGKAWCLRCGAAIWVEAA